MTPSKRQLSKPILSGSVLDILREGFTEGSSREQREKAERVINQLASKIRDSNSSLSENDWRDLEEGFANGASKVERQKIESVVSRFGYVRIKTTGKRPGPRRKDSINPTDEIVRLFVNIIRLMLGLSEDTPKMTVLGILDHILSKGRVLKDNFLLSPSDIARLDPLSLRLGEVDADVLAEARNLVDSCREELPMLTPNETLSGMARKYKSQANLDIQDEKALYSNLKVKLDLQVKAHFRKSSEPRTLAASSGGKTSKSTISKREILITAIGRLLHVGSVLSLTRRTISFELSEEIREFLRQYDNPAIFDEKEVGDRVGEFCDFFLAIRKRQGMRLRLEEMNLETRELQVGQVWEGL